MGEYQGTAIPTGVVQSSYPNQAATALPGQLVNAGETNLVDSAVVLGSNAIGAGLAAFYLSNTYNARTGVNQAGIQDAANALTAATATAANFYGVAMRTQAGWSTGSNSPVWPTGIMAPVARSVRAACRVWVATSTIDTTADSDPVYVVVSNLVAGNTRTIGSFTNSAITGAGNTDTVLIPGAAFHSPGASTVGHVEFAQVVSTQAPLTVTVTGSAETSDTQTITIQASQAALSEFRFTVNPTSADAAAAATSTDTFGGPSAGQIITTNTAKADYSVETDATGKYVFTLNVGNHGATTRYFKVYLAGRVFQASVAFAGA